MEYNGGIEIGLSGGLWLTKFIANTTTLRTIWAKLGKNCNEAWRSFGASEIMVYIRSFSFILLEYFITE